MPVVSSVVSFTQNLSKVCRLTPNLCSYLKQNVFQGNIYGGITLTTQTLGVKLHNTTFKIASGFSHCQGFEYILKSKTNRELKKKKNYSGHDQIFAILREQNFHYKQHFLNLQTTLCVLECLLHRNWKQQKELHSKMWCKSECGKCSCESEGGQVQTQTSLVLSHGWKS